jgi:hypothetical protein
MVPCAVWRQRVKPRSALAERQPGEDFHVAERPLIDPQAAQTLQESVLSRLQNNPRYAIEKALA